LRILALPPDPAGAVPVTPELARHGLRTIPPRETAGNLDIKQLVAGTTLLIPVAMPTSR
jgi:formamidase